jgi:hypothetical protein
MNCFYHVHAQFTCEYEPCIVNILHMSLLHSALHDLQETGFKEKFQRKYKYYKRNGKIGFLKIDFYEIENFNDLVLRGKVRLMTQR